MNKQNRDSFIILIIALFITVIVVAMVIKSYNSYQEFCENNNYDRYDGEHKCYKVEGNNKIYSDKIEYCNKQLCFVKEVSNAK